MSHKYKILSLIGRMDEVHKVYHSSGVNTVRILQKIAKIHI